MNQITSLFGKPHDDFLSRLRKATKRREKRALAARAVVAVGRLIRLRKKEIALLVELRGRLRDYHDALEDGMDGKLAGAILRGRKKE